MLAPVKHVREGSDLPGVSTTGRARHDLDSGRSVWPEDPIELLRSLYPLLRNTARSMASARDLEDADDRVQDALVEVLTRHPRFEGIEYPFGYAKTVLVRRAYSCRRRRLWEVPLELQEKLRPNAAEELEEGVDDRLATEEALRGLGRKQRICIWLRYMQDLDDLEIASVLGCSASTVRSQIARGLRKMRPGLLNEEIPPRTEGAEA